MGSIPTPTGLLRTLAIDPGTREMGYVVLEGTELLHFGVHTFPHRLADHQLLDEGQRFERALIDTFAPHLFVIEQTRYAHSKRSPRVHRLVAAMQRLVKRRGLLVVAYPASRVKDTLVGDKAAPRRHVAETLVRQGYPYLARYLTTDLRTQERYWENMFDALALGLTAYEEVSKEKMLRTGWWSHPRAVSDRPGGLAYS
jgi:Holliday junction resolvasome RuvABC endonuclease subunit